MDSDVFELVSCPSCCEKMDHFLVVCWECWLTSNRLQVGVHHGGTWVAELTQELVDRWFALRDARLGR